MLKIYYASQSFYPHIGGVSTYLLNLCKEMVKRQNTVIEVHLRPAGEINEEEIKGIQVHRVPREPIDGELMKGYSKFKEALYTESHYNKRQFTKEASLMPGFSEYNTVNEYFGAELRELLEENPADVVHIHDFQLLFTYRYVPRGTPLILTWHIPFIRNMSKPLKEFLIKHMREYDKVVFSSQEYIDSAVKAGLEKDRCELIHPIANTDIFKKIEVSRDKELAKYSIPKASKVILCVQRIDPKSGHEQLIKAMPSVLKTIPEAKLVFVGSQSLSNKLSKEREKLTKRVKKLVKDLKLQKKVIFTGNIDYHELPRLYNCSDLVALCSKNEGFGLSVTEGMACGNPIVGTKVGGIPIQVRSGYNGLLVKVGDVRATSRAIKDILKDDKLRERMAENALKMVEKNFTIEVGIEKHAILYNKAIEAKDEFHKLEFMPREKIRGIITDLDRTITDKPAKPNFDKSDYDRGLFKDLKHLDIDLFLATGRNIHYVKKLCKTFKIWRAVIAENGAVVYIPEHDKTITTNTLAMTRAKKIIREMNLPGTVIGKVIASIPSKNEKMVKKELGSLADQVSYHLNVDEIMILPYDVDKGQGVRLAMQYLGIDIEKTICIGDGENDVDMFMNPGFKIAVSNASAKLKELSNQVTNAPSTEGVREVIKKLRM